MLAEICEVVMSIEVSGASMAVKDEILVEDWFAVREKD